MNLKPCPFCGTDPMWLTKVTFECNNHECVIGGHKIRDAEAWNKRALPPEGREPKFLGTFFGFKVYEDPALKEGEFRVQNDAQITNEMLAVEGMEWIAVGTSDVPAEGEHVLTFNDKDRCAYTSYTQDGRWYHANGDGSERYVIKGVTHWMECPSSPQEGSQ